jgi:hypothetical protein
MSNLVELLDRASLDGGVVGLGRFHRVFGSP